SYDQAVLTALRTHPDVIICSQTIAERSGADLCHDIRAALKRADGPHVIFLSRSQTPDIIRRTDSGQGAYYLRKPFETAVLLKLIKCAV
ncbi:MAG: response regulator transcription factor, partial [Planctomycetia bacterium]|nr:response regulator transcription factor [Planctomycetia bacterium]